MDAIVKLCDQCGARINGTRFEMRYLLIEYRPARVEVFHKREICGEDCLAKANAALVRKVREAPDPVPASKPDCHSINTAA